MASHAKAPEMHRGLLTLPLSGPGRRVGQDLLDRRGPGEEVLAALPTRMPSPETRSPGRSALAPLGFRPRRLLPEDDWRLDLTSQDVEAFIRLKAFEGRASKSILNYVVFLDSVFSFAAKRGWAYRNPCKAVDKPRASAVDPDIRFLDEAELEALLRAVPTKCVWWRNCSTEAEALEAIGLTEQDAHAET
jgi:hypothetical protein